jgi:hypothetical protein
MSHQKGTADMQNGSSSRRRRIDGHKRLLTVAATVSLATVSAMAASSASSQTSVPVAHSAKALSLNENGSLRLTSKHGFTLNEQGLASGTVKGTIYVHLSIVSSSHVTAELSIYPNGGSITAKGSASYRKESTLAHFSGAISIERGTGGYAHARGSGLSFSGTIQRSNDSVTVHVAGNAVD